MKISTPEHDKLKLIEKDKEIIANFLEWLKENYNICGESEAEDFSGGMGAYYQTYDGIEVIMARYFKIDLVKLDKEKVKILEFIRKGNK